MQPHLYACDITILAESHRSVAYAIHQLQHGLEPQLTYRDLLYTKPAPANLVQSGWSDLKHGDTDEAEATALLHACKLAVERSTIVTDLVFPTTNSLRLSHTNPIHSDLLATISSLSASKRLVFEHPLATEFTHYLHSLSHKEASRLMKAKRPEYCMSATLDYLLKDIGLSDQQRLELEKRLSPHIKVFPLGRLQQLQRGRQI